MILFILLALHTEVLAYKKQLPYWRLYLAILFLAGNWWKWECFQETKKKKWKWLLVGISFAVNEAKHYFKGKTEVTAEAIYTWTPLHEGHPP